MESGIEDFQILNKLGSGSFSDVYKVKRKSDGFLYAMKKIKMSLLNAKEKENTLNEIRILASFSSRNLIQYKDCILDKDANILCIIMELASEGDLKQLIEISRLKGGVDENDVWDLLVQITLGLKILHDKKILHRDLKCENIFVSQTDEGKIYKIGDLNISKVTVQGKANTQTGTPYYAPPEIWRGETYQSSCDIWSLGCILYEITTCRPPFRANDIQELNQKIQKGYYDPIPTKYSKELSAIISTMLRTNPNARPSCLQILKNPIVTQKCHQTLIKFEDSQQEQDELLKTIKLPQNIQQLKNVLPKAQYNKINNRPRASSLTERNSLKQGVPILKDSNVKIQSTNKPLLCKPPKNMKDSNPILLQKISQVSSRNYHHVNSPSQKSINDMNKKFDFTPKGLEQKKFYVMKMFHQMEVQSLLNSSLNSINYIKKHIRIIFY